MFFRLRKIFQAFCFFVLLACFSSVTASSAYAGKAGINIGDHFGEVDQAAAIVGDDGWIVVMAQPGDCLALSEMIKKHSNINFIIRGHHPSTGVMSPEHAKAWAYTLANMDTGGNKIYFYPINEPFTWGAREGFSDNPDTTADMVNAYVDALMGTVGGLRNKVTFLSPMINRSHPDFVANVERLGGSSFFDKFDGIAMNLYDFEDCGSPFCHANQAGNAGKFQETLSIMGVDKPVYGVESGVVPPGDQGVKYSDQLLLPFYRAGYQGGPFSDNSDSGRNLVMTATFSYDPHSAGWSIYNSQTAAFFSSPDTGNGRTPEKYNWEEEEDVQLYIDNEIIAGRLAKCDECGVSPVTATGEKFCSGTGKYNLEIFPDYEYDEKDYYLYPICIDGEGCRAGSVDDQLISYKKSLIEQGYEAHCAENELYIGGQYNSAWLDYLEALKIGLAFDPLPDPEFVTESQQIIDYTNLKVPVFRDQSGKRWRMTSIEEFFGFRDIYTGEDTQALLNSGPIEKLMTEEQRCDMAVEVIRDARTLCARENRDLNECALNTEIPDPSNKFNGKKRFDVWEEYAAGGTTCSQLVKTDNPLKEMLLNTPLYLERAYRVGFLVTTLRHLTPENQGQFFNFMSEPYFNSSIGRQYGSKMTEVSIIAFKIPDVGLSHHKDLKYNDPLQLTRDSVLSTEQRKKVTETQEDSQEYLKHNSYTEYSEPPGSGAVEGGQRFMGGESLINCAFTPGCGAYSQILDPLYRSIVDIVNAEVGYVNDEGKVVPGPAYIKQAPEEGAPPGPERAYLNCKPTHVKITPEKVEILGDSANISNQDNHAEAINDLGNLNKKMMESLIQRLRTTNTNVTRSDLPNFITDFKLTDRNTPDRVVELNTYLVYPGDYEIGTVADAIRSPFVPFEIAEQVDENRRDGCDPYEKECQASNPKRSLRFSAILGEMFLAGGNVSHMFVDGNDPIGCDAFDATPTPNDDCPIKTFSLDVVSDVQKVVAFPGEKIGFWMKEIQKSLSSASTEHFSYLQRCRTTEEFLLGACGGGILAGPGQNFPLPPVTEGTNPFPPAPVWSAIMMASQKHGCDPYMLAAVAFTESGYDPNAYNSDFGAAGLFQHIQTTWDLWWRSGTHQPSTYDPSAPEFTPKVRTNIYASADAACRQLLWIGVQKYPDNPTQFARAFARYGDNPSCQIWNSSTEHGTKVHGIWLDFLQRASASPLPQPQGYPASGCRER